MPSSPLDAERDGAPVPRAERPSKTQRKKQSHDLQSLGEELAALTDQRLAALRDQGLSEPLFDAIQQLKRTRSFEGQRRQLQYVGKLMRQADAAPLREAVAAQKLPNARATLALHQAERWRERLLHGDEAVTQWLAVHPASDAQQLRSLLRAARKDGDKPVGERQGRPYRELFRFIQAALAEQAASGPSDDERDDD